MGWVAVDGGEAAELGGALFGDGGHGGNGGQATNGTGGTGGAGGNAIGLSAVAVTRALGAMERCPAAAAVAAMPP